MLCLPYSLDVTLNFPNMWFQKWLGTDKYYFGHPTKFNLLHMKTMDFESLFFRTEFSEARPFARAAIWVAFDRNQQEWQQNLPLRGEIRRRHSDAAGLLDQSQNRSRFTSGSLHCQVLLQIVKLGVGLKSRQIGREQDLNSGRMEDKYTALPLSHRITTFKLVHCTGLLLVM